VMTKQIIWLEKVLKENTNRWTVVTQHHPVISTGSEKNSDAVWRKKLETLFKKYKVDLSLQGHEHTYARGVNMPVGQRRKNPDGPVYVVSVSGPKMGRLNLQNWMDRAAVNTQLYQTITISDNKLSYQAYAVSGDLYDAFELNKNKKGGNQLVDLSRKIKTPERIEIPETMRSGLKEEQLKDFNDRFKAYKKRKGLE